MDCVRVEPRGLSSLVRRRRFGRTICFLCGRGLTPKNRSDEHVIPKWAQNRFSLWNQKMMLLNETHIRYRSLTIPCCCEYNTVHLHPSERGSESRLLKAPCCRGP